MKKLLIFCSFMIMGIETNAYGFSAVNSDGVTIYYNVTSTTTCEVMKEDYYYYSALPSFPLLQGRSPKQSRTCH